jgi:hypothetical protein
MFGKDALLKHVEQLITAAEKIKNAARDKADWVEIARMDQLLVSQVNQLEKQTAIFCK